MTRDEVRQLQLLIAAIDVRRPPFGSVDVDVWTDLLDEEPSFADARAAVIAHYRRSPHPVMPSEVIAGCRSRREDRFQRDTRRALPPPDGVPMPPGFREQVARLWRRPDAEASSS